MPRRANTQTQQEAVQEQWPECDGRSDHEVADDVLTKAVEDKDYKVVSVG